MITVNSRERFLIKAMRQLRTISAEVPTFAEIGVLDGEFSRTILDVINPLLWLIDPFNKGTTIYNGGMEYLPTAYSTDQNYANVYRTFEHEIETGKVVILRKYSHDAVINFVDEYFDFIYHDASHLYEDLKRDLSEWLPKLKPGGIIAGHDYIEHESFGVIQAVDEFCTDHNFEMIIFNENGGDYALKQKV